MSRAPAQVRFPDGTIKYGVYNGTSDAYWPYLYATSEEAWEAYDSNRKPSIPYYIYDEWAYKVEIADDYGSGHTYQGMADPQELLGPLTIQKMWKVKDGLPDWWVNHEV